MISVPRVVIPGAYVVEIEGFNVAVGATQTFGAAANPSLINCASAGTLTTGRNRIACSGVLDLRVVDCDLNADDGIVETTSVAAVSDSEPAGETIVLTESAPEAAEFLGSITVDPVDAAGVLQVSEGDTITVTYIDADDGAGSTNVPVVRSVVVDCTPPGITSVVVSEVNPRDATVDVTLSEPARVTVSFGAVCGAPTGSAAAVGFDTTHQIALTGLSDDSVYLFTVEAEDEAGNVSTDDNSGAPAPEGVPPIP